MTLTMPIFWKATASLFMILALSTLLGRPLAVFFPGRFRAQAKFYLAPSLGLAFILLFIAVWGRYFPFGDTSLFPLLLFGFLAFSLVRENSPKLALSHAILVGSFGVISCAGLLVPLFLTGGFNAYNDAFTYLAHSDWLQLHAFNETISPNDVTPASTQVVLYQQMGFRMGGTYLLGFFQSILSVRWSYEVYPAVVAAPVAAAALGCGFPVARQLRRYSRVERLVLLSVACNTLGGFVFGASYGFLSQTYGVMFGAAALFSFGVVLPCIGDASVRLSKRLAPIVPVGMLIAASVFSYSEISPFLLLAGFFATVIFCVRKHVVLPYFYFAAGAGALSALLLNVELKRSIAALLIQKGAVVGSPVNWTVMGLLGHILGVHGGAWDGHQWGLATATSSNFWIGTLLTAIICAVVILNIRHLRRPFHSGSLLPSAILLILLALGIVYFRYGVPSPFPVGVGQSWSQFKLANWSQPFVFALMLSILLPVCVGKIHRRRMLVVAALLASAAGVSFGIERSRLVLRDYPGVTNVMHYYSSFRSEVARACGTAPATFLDLTGGDHKLRQMISLFLDDRRLKADWTGDNYIENWLPRERVKAALVKGDCLIERPPTGQHVSPRPLVAAVYPATPYLRIEKVEGLFEKEGDSSDWWVWVHKTVKIVLASRGGAFEGKSVSFRFAIAAVKAQTINVTFTWEDGRTKLMQLTVREGLEDMELLLNDHPDELIGVSLTSDAASQRIGNTDDRMVTFRLQNARFRVVDSVK